MTKPKTKREKEEAKLERAVERAGKKQARAIETKFISQPDKSRRVKGISM